MLSRVRVCDPPGLPRARVRLGYPDCQDHSDLLRHRPNHLDRLNRLNHLSHIDHLNRLEWLEHLSRPERFRGGGRSKYLRYLICLRCLRCLRRSSNLDRLCRSRASTSLLYIVADVNLLLFNTFYFIKI